SASVCRAQWCRHFQVSASNTGAVRADMLTVHIYVLTINILTGYAPAFGIMGRQQPQREVQYGTLDLMVLKTLDVMGPLHGYRLARRIEQLAEGSFALNQGTIYPALLRLEQKGWISSKWGVTETNRRARFYAITRAGRKQLAVEARGWTRTV